MPRGHRGRRGGAAGQVCPRRIQRFLEPCLLLLLHHRQAHGYELLDELKRLGLHENQVELSTVYRLLRNLEEQGLAVSHWDTGNVGPARRQYNITAEGDRYLAQWVEDLRETDRLLHRFLDMYDIHMQVHQQEFR